jgi:hypothetical protein
MSEANLENEERPVGDAPRLERWLLMMLLAIAPIAISIVLPREVRVYLAAISGMLFLAGVAMFVAHERRR